MKLATSAAVLLFFAFSGPVSAEIVFNSLSARIRGGFFPDEEDQLIAQQFLLGDNNTVSSATIDMGGTGSPTGTAHLEIWDDSGFGTPGQFVGLLGSIDIADVITGQGGGKHTVDTAVTGLTPNEPYYLIMSFHEIFMNNSNRAAWGVVEKTAQLTAANGSALEGMVTQIGTRDWVAERNYPGGPPFPVYHVASINAITTVPELLSDLTGNGFVDFEDLTVLLANWNKDVGVDAGNLVDADTTPVNFEDLTVLLADWTGPGPAGSPEAAMGAEAVPEPSAAVLAALGLIGLCACTQRRRGRIGQ